MLNQFTYHAAQDWCLISYLHDVRQKFQTIYGAHAHVKSNQKAAEIFKKLCGNSEERAQLKWAIENSTDKEASKIFAKYVPHLEFAGCQVSYGATFNSQLKSKVIESCKQYGPPSGFLTVSFTMILITPGAFRHVSKHHQISHFHKVLTKIQVLATAQLSSCTTCKPVQCYGLKTPLLYPEVFGQH